MGVLCHLVEECQNIIQKYQINYIGNHDTSEADILYNASQHPNQLTLVHVKFEISQILHVFLGIV